MGDSPISQVLEEATVGDLQSKMGSGELTAEELVMLYMERIAACDAGGPRLNSILEINPDALEIAYALDVERSRSGPRGPLHGIPVLLKDNIDTGDKMHTSAGSLALADSIAREDSFVARRLREAGAVILGKANMTEWANFMTSGMPNGYSSRGGQVLNPYGPGEFDVGGSSSGSGAAVAANLVTLAVGTETSGSILSPASRNCLVGIKPSIGLVSRSGIVPISHVQDTAGPLARTVADAAILLHALAGRDPKDPVTSGGPGFFDYEECLDAGGLDGLHVGYVPAPGEGLDEETRAVVDSAVQVIKDLGAKVYHVAFEFPSQWRFFALTHEFKVDLNAYLAKLGPDSPVHSLKDVIKFNSRNPEKTLKYGQSLLVAAEATDGTLRHPEYIQARLHDLRSSRQEGIDRLLARYRLDVILFPQIFGAAVSARAGYPSIAVPAGFGSGGLPLNIMFTGGRFSEPLLVKVASAFEQATKARKAPVLTVGERAEG